MNLTRKLERRLIIGFYRRTRSNSTGDTIFIGDFEQLQVGDEVRFAEEGDTGLQASTVRPRLDAVYNRPFN